MSTKVAFIGLGIMGSPMAVHLQNGDYDVTGFNRSPEATQPLVEAGGTAADSTAEAVKDAEVVCVMVPDSPDVQDVLLGEDGVLANVPKGALVIDFSSIRPDVTKELAEAAGEAGVRLLDAPVSGGEAGAKNAALSIMVGGDEADFKEAQPLLETVGKTVVHVGLAAPARRSRPPTSSSSRPTSRPSPRRWSSSRRTASTPRRRWTCSAAGSPAAPC